MLITLAADVGHPLSAEKGTIALRAGCHCAPGEIAKLLAIALTVRDVRAERISVEIRCYWRQSFVIDGRNYHVASSAVEGLAHRDIIHVIILHTSGHQLADDFGKRDGPARVARAVVVMISVFMFVWFILRFPGFNELDSYQTAL